MTAGFMRYLLRLNYSRKILKAQQRGNEHLANERRETAVPKILVLGASLVVFPLILVLGVIRFAASKLDHSDRETALVAPVPTPESTPAPTPAATLSLQTSPHPGINWERLFGYAALHSIHGLDFYNKNDYDRAIAEYTEAIKSDPNNDFANASAYYYRGLAYGYKNEYDKAIHDFNRAILLNPNRATAYYYRGLAYYHKNEYGQAIRDFNRAIFLDPTDPTAYYYRGVVYQEQGKDDEAQADYDKARQFGY